MRRLVYAGHGEESGREVNIEHGLRPDRPGVKAWAADEKRDLDVDLKREAFTFDDAKLAQVVAVVGRVDDVRVVQLAQVGKLSVELMEKRKRL